MHKTILIPTGFSMVSLKLLQNYLNKNEFGRFTVIILHKARLSDSITELLFYSKEKHITELCDDTYFEALNIMHNRYGQRLEKIKLDLFTGWTQSSFQNQMDALKVDSILLPSEEVINSKHHTEGAALLGHCLKSNIELQHIALPAKNQQTSKRPELAKEEKLAELFF